MFGSSFCPLLIAKGSTSRRGILVGKEADQFLVMIAGHPLGDQIFLDHGDQVPQARSHGAGSLGLLNTSTALRPKLRWERSKLSGSGTEMEHPGIFVTIPSRLSSACPLRGISFLISNPSRERSPWRNAMKSNPLVTGIVRWNHSGHEVGRRCEFASTLHLGGLGLFRRAVECGV